MATCKDCIHDNACTSIFLFYGGNAECNEQNVEKHCKCFENRARFKKFPCKVGDPVWFVGTSNINRLKLGVIETTVEKLVLKAGGTYMKLACNAMYETSCRSIGKTVFFNREEAEKALAERSKNER